jgi:hypothetical protein
LDCYFLRPKNQDLGLHPAEALVVMVVLYSLGLLLS